MIVAQPERIALHQQLVRYGGVLHGDVLDVGAGRFNRYRVCCPNVAFWRTLDPDPRWQADIIASAEAIPTPDASFDGVLCTQVLEHVAHPQAVVREIFRVLKPGGVCLLTIPQWNELHEEPHDYFRYTKYGLRVLFEEAGFRVDVIDQRGKYHSVLAQTIIRRWIDRYRPYENRLARLFLVLPATLLTRWALWRDNHSSHPADAAHALGWCIVATKA
ncbi:MAG: hypothetical protein G01um101425_75 [Candidatus Peregrinibacteria bacterium Gr01-1014_25]|nr:MAG: hypothetical protein G01um101425_75 [Candidatus Peregrinibacteria bacterium Gr01-1014_25]